MVNIKKLNKQTAWQTIALVLFANFILFLIYHNTLYVPQPSYSSYDSLMDSIADSQAPVCAENAAGAFKELNFGPCNRDCAVCLSFSQENIKKQVELQIESDSAIKVVVKSWDKMPKDFSLILTKLSAIFGVQEDKAKSSKHDIKSIQIELFNSQTSVDVHSIASNFLDKIWTPKDPRRP